MKKIIVLLLAILLLNTPICKANQEANQIGNEGIMLIQKGSMDEGLGYLKKATEISPESADWHMNYGSMLFMKGQQVFQSAGKTQSIDVFTEAEKELLAAIKLFGQSDAMLIGQCYFILGDIYSHVHEDKARAKAFYQQSLDNYPGHGGAAEAMKRVQ